MSEQRSRHVIKLRDVHADAVRMEVGVYEAGHETFAMEVNMSSNVGFDGPGGNFGNPAVLYDYSGVILEFG